MTRVVLSTAGRRTLVSYSISEVEMGLKVANNYDQTPSEMGMTKVKDSKKDPLS